MQNYKIVVSVFVLLAVALLLYLREPASLSQDPFNFELGHSEYVPNIGNDEGRNRISLYDTQAMESGQISVVQKWNQIALEAIAGNQMSPPQASRFLALMHIAMFEVANYTTLQERPVAVDDAAPENSRIAGTTKDFRYDPWDPQMQRVLAPREGALVNTEALIDGAGGAMFELFFPEFTGLVERELARHVENGYDFELGTSYRVAESLFRLRVNDGSYDDVEYTPEWYDQVIADQYALTAIGKWRPTPPYYEDALLPQWQGVTPFVVDFDDTFVPEPYELDSVEYARQYEQVKTLGGRESTQRTQEQNLIAHYWAENKGTYTPPGHWNLILHDVLARKREAGDVPDLVDEARYYALMNIALADAAMHTWKSKYAFGYWRPIDAIQLGSIDGNDATEPDEKWFNLIETPNFPEYPSGHSSFSGAASTVLSQLFGDEVTFSSYSLGVPGVTREFKSFSSAAAEAGISRIYGGIHFMQANVEGQNLGSSIGRQVVEKTFLRR